MFGLTKQAEIDPPRPGAGTLVLPFGRARLLNFMPKGGDIVELGVARAQFSIQLLRRVRPRRLTLIDAWEKQDETVYSGDGNNAPHDEQQRRYRKAQFLASLARPLTRVEVWRAYTTTAAAHFENSSLDLVYVDANHGYSAVLDDLRHYEPKVRPAGLLMGHDFTGPHTGHIGVATAVTAFLRESTEWRLFAITVEHFPTFVLGRDAAAEHVLFRNLYRRGVAQIMVDPAAILTLRLTRLSVPRQRRKALMRLGFPPHQEQNCDHTETAQAAAGSGPRSRGSS